MKQRSTSPKLIAAALCISAGIWGNLPVAAAGRPALRVYNGNEEPKNEKPAKKEKIKSRVLSSRNNQSVKIFPDVIKRDMHVVAKDNDGKEIEFFVFDLQGTLVQNQKMKARDHIRLSGLARGKYQYHVFCGDVETATGYFEIR